MDWQKLKEEIQRLGSNYIESRCEHSRDNDISLDDSLAIDVLDYILDVIKDLESEELKNQSLDFVSYRFITDEAMGKTLEDVNETLEDWLAKVLASKAYKKG